MICVSSNEVYILNPRLDIRTARTFSPRTRICIFGPYKSNASRDGTKLAVRATNRQGEFVAFAYDILTRRKYLDIELTNFVRSQRILHNRAVRPLPVLRSRGLRKHTADIGKRSPVADRELLEDMMQVD
jgi:hypothetical protein